MGRENEATPPIESIDDRPCLQVTYLRKVSLLLHAINDIDALQSIIAAQLSSHSDGSMVNKSHVCRKELQHNYISFADAVRDDDDSKNSNFMHVLNFFGFFSSSFSSD